MILGLEMSRLARSNKDWHQLLELCALFRTLLADQDGLYDPTDYNDRLLLGLKGTMSEAELHVLRARMYQGLLNKARRGEVFNHPPVGYVKLPAGGVRPGPRRAGAGRRPPALRPVRAAGHRQRPAALPGRSTTSACRSGRTAAPTAVSWNGVAPTGSRCRACCTTPSTPGYYRWGHRACDPRRKVGGRPGTGRTVRRPEECLVLLEGRCPAYITAERFWANQQRLQANRAASLKGVRHGPSLLGGLLVCGRCGRRMVVSYTNAGRGLRYSCARGRDRLRRAGLPEPVGPAPGCPGQRGRS